MALFDAPIPGQSLTSEPRNAPFERPPEIVNPEEALMVHLERLNDVDKMEAVVFAVDLGIDVQTITKGILRSAVMEGIHSIDVSLIIAPAVHSFIASTLDAVGVDYDDGFEDKEEAKRTREASNKFRIKDMLMGKDTQEDMSEVKVVEEEEVPVEEEQSEPKGLMARV
ncbi:hypothetical protein N9465_00330 [Gammaproteobacteria bacterium]|nr:hypothetical protein [Gammaproteobacteria bacterium]MDC3368023.1 hypothetical protein [bacterium]